MGVLLHLVTDTGEDIPAGYSFGADPKQFCWKVSEYASHEVGEIQLLLNHFGLSLEPLTKLSGEGYTLEEWMSPHFKPYGDWEEWTDEMKLEAWKKHRAAIEASYQDPSVLIDSIGPFIEALENNPTVYEIVDIADSYFTRGSFLLHMKDLMHQAEWAQSQGIRRVRLLVA